MSRIARDEVGVVRAVDDQGTGVTYEKEWREVFGRGNVGAAGRRTVSKGSSRGDGPQKKVGTVRRRGGDADDVELCPHGQAKVVHCACGDTFCSCPGGPKHVCLVTPP